LNTVRCPQTLGLNFIHTNLYGWDQAAQVQRRGAMTSQTTCCKSVALTQVGDYVDRIMKRSKLCKWGFTSKDAAKLRKRLKGYEHENPYMPIGVDIWLGRDLQYNWLQVTDWLRDEVMTSGHKLLVFFKSSDLSFLPGCGRKSGLGLSIVKLDFKTFWNPLESLSDKKVLSNRPIWPGLEIAWFLALNPQIFTNMDGAIIPYLQAPGLVVYETGMPSFYHDEHFVYIMPNWHDNSSRSKFVSTAAYVSN